MPGNSKIDALGQNPHTNGNKWQEKKSSYMRNFIDGLEKEFCTRLRMLTSASQHENGAIFGAVRYPSYGRTEKFTDEATVCDN